MNLFEFNGIDQETGRYLRQPMAPKAAAAMARTEPRFGRTPAKYVEKALPEGANPKNLSKTGWGLILPKGASPAVLESLGVLLDLRRRQATGKDGCLYRMFVEENGYQPGESKTDFIERQLSKPAMLLPTDGHLPYYLLLVGSPQEIPYSFQYQLGVDFAVGRLDLQSLADYKSYARNVVACERAAAATANLQLAYFCPSNRNEPLMDLACHELVEPLAQRCEKYPATRISHIQGTEATRDRLAELVGGRETPSLLFTASHGLGYRLGQRYQQQRQGALICDDWPGLEHPVSYNRHCFGADHLHPDARLAGLVAFLFACHSAGTPQESSFHIADARVEPKQAECAFTALLPQRLLAQGAQAVIGHVDIAWQWSFCWGLAPQHCGAFENALVSMLRGHPVGHAMQYFWRRYAALSTDLDAEVRRPKGGNDIRVSGLWVARNDTRNYIVLGDPATRVPATVATDADANR